MIKKGMKLFVSLICLALIVYFVRTKQDTIRVKNNKPIVSFYSQYQKDGKPVDVLKIKAVTFDDKIKTTISCLDGNKFYGFVSKKAFEKISKENLVSFKKGNILINGTIKNLYSSIDKDRGLYKIEGEICSDDNISGTNYIAEIITGQKNDIITLPIEAVEIIDNKPFVWVAKDGKAYIREVKLGHQKSDSYIIAEGLSNDDVVIVKGIKELKNNDKIYIVNLGENK